MKKEKSLFFRIAEYGIKHREGFTKEELFGALELNGMEKGWIEGYMQNNAASNTYGDVFINFKNNRNLLSASAEQAYLDYLELLEVRRSSRNAMKVAAGSLILAILTGMAQVWAQLAPDSMRSVISCIF